MKKILIVAGYYTPSVKGGGPIQSIRNMVENLGHKCQFYILANDRDLGDKKPFNNIESNKWIQKYGTNIFYTDVKKLSFKKLLIILKSQKFEKLYLNSFFSFSLSMKPYFLFKLGLINFEKIIIAPRGNFTKGALGQKSFKKKLYIKFSRLFKLYRDVIWHATNEEEMVDIRKNIDRKGEIVVANNLTRNYKNCKYLKRIDKLAGTLKLVYISRIHPMKNLLQTLQVLSKVKGNVIFNIFGPIEDEEYWNKCCDYINKLRDNIEINYMGILNNDNVINTYRIHHVAILMSLGENFGHTITEALIGGCPIILSDRTPWRGLEKLNVGYDISLDNNDMFARTIENYISMSSKDYTEISKKAFEYGRRESNKRCVVKSYHNLFGL